MVSSPYDAAFEQTPISEEIQIEDELEISTLALLNRGYITSTVDIGSHKIVIRTLRIGEELEAALVADKYKETIEAGRGLITAIVAAAIVTVDGQSLITPLGNEDITIEDKFNQILDWYWVTISPLYEEYNRLQTEMYELYLKLKKD